MVATALEAAARATAGTEGRHSERLAVEAAMAEGETAEVVEAKVQGAVKGRAGVATALVAAETEEEAKTAPAGLASVTAEAAGCETMHQTTQSSTGRHRTRCPRRSRRPGSTCSLASRRTRCTSCCGHASS